MWLLGKYWNNPCCMLLCGIFEMLHALICCPCWLFIPKWPKPGFCLNLPHRILEAQKRAAGPDALQNLEANVNNAVKEKVTNTVFGKGDQEAGQVEIQGLPEPPQQMAPPPQHK